MNQFTKFFATPGRRIAGVVGILFVIGFVVSFGGADTPSGASRTATAVAPVDPATLAADKEKLAVLKTKFNYKYDEFEKKGWYEAKTQVVDSTFDKNVLRLRVNNSGYSYLEDQYYGDDWIFHTRVEVKIGDAVYKSEDIASFDSDNSRENSGGSVWETLSYTRERDNGIAKAIAGSGDAPVKVRFAGGDGVYDFTLAKRDQQAIKDAYELARLIKETGDTGTQS